MNEILSMALKNSPFSGREKRKTPKGDESVCGYSGSTEQGSE